MIFEQLYTSTYKMYRLQDLFSNVSDKTDQVKKPALCVSHESPGTCSPVSGSHRPPQCARQPIGSLASKHHQISPVTHSIHHSMQLGLPNPCTANVLGHNQSESHRPRCDHQIAAAITSRLFIILPVSCVLQGFLSFCYCYSYLLRFRSNREGYCVAKVYVMYDHDCH